LLVAFDGLDVDAELTFAQQMLEQDVLNNSAWNHRFFCTCLAHRPEVGEELALQEVSFAMERLTRAPENDAAWSYALSWCRQLPKGCGTKASDDAMEAARSAVLEACEKIESSTQQEVLGCLGTRAMPRHGSRFALRS
jgi:hypothetical protein